MLDLVNINNLSGLEELNLIHRLVVNLEFQSIDQYQIGKIEGQLRDLINKSSEK